MSRARLLRAPERAMIAVADAGYALEADDETWLRGVLEAARPLLDHGSFVHGWIIDGGGHFRSCAAIQMPEGADFERDVRARRPSPSHPDVPNAMRPAWLTTATEFTDDDADLAERVGFPPGFGVADAIALAASDPSGIATALIGALPRRGRFSERDRAKWGRVAAHLGAALRLRERLRATPAEARLDAADALLDPRTHALAHATAAVDTHLEAIRASAEVLAARHRTATDPARLVAAWRALVAGRWSLVDGFDTDGKRFFVLRKNEPSAPGPQVLTGTQRAIAAYVAMGHSNKAIAYHLGLAESSVSRAVDAICATLGLSSRAALAQLGAALGAHPGGADA